MTILAAEIIFAVRDRGLAVLRRLDLPAQQNPQLAQGLA
jgi:hypothetical protein